MRLKSGRCLAICLCLAGVAPMGQALAAPSPAAPPAAAGAQAVNIPSGGVELHAAFYPATTGAGPRPTALILHGVPGQLAMRFRPDLATALAARGWNAVVLNYRGSLGDPGDFSFGHELEDVAAALAWLRDPAVVKPREVAASKLVLIGHSVGGWAAVLEGAKDKDLAAVVLISPYDLSFAVADPADNEGARRTLASLGPSGALKAPSVDALVKEVVDKGDAWSMIKAGARLTDKPVLMLTADDGGVVFTRPFEDTVRGAGGGRLLTLHHVDSTDHSWTVYAPQMLDWVTEWLKPLE